MKSAARSRCFVVAIKAGKGGLPRAFWRTWVVTKLGCGLGRPREAMPVVIEAAEAIIQKAH